VITDSQQNNYHIKKGTKMSAGFGLALQDDKFFRDPSIFNSNRFLPESIEPKPVLSMGCPLGYETNEKFLYESHCCLFVRMAQPFVKDFLVFLLDDFRFQLQFGNDGGLLPWRSSSESSTRFLQKQLKILKKTENELKVDYSELTGGIMEYAMIPAVFSSLLKPVKLKSLIHIGEKNEDDDANDLENHVVVKKEN
jgi:hypothetical protein